MSYCFEQNLQKMMLRYYKDLATQRLPNIAANQLDPLYLLML